MTISVSIGTQFYNEELELCEIMGLKISGVVIKTYHAVGPRYYKISYRHLKEMLKCDTLHILEE